MSDVTDHRMMCVRRTGIYQNSICRPAADPMQEDCPMMFFRKKPALIKVTGVTAPKPVRHTAEIAVKTTRKADSDGRVRRMLRTVEDNRLL